MMKRIFLLLSIFCLLIACRDTLSTNSLMVHDAAALQQAIETAKPGDEIILSNGIWKDLNIKFAAKGTKDQSITLRAETPGKVLIQGESNLRLGGEYLVVDGLHFSNGFSPQGSVIEFAINDKMIANHCRITNCVIEGFNKMQRNQTDLWVLFKGRHNQMDHCYLAGKSNRGPTVRISLAGNEHIKNYHQIIHNHFGPRPPKGGPSAETIQLGNSFTSMAPSHTLVADNLFERCNGEVEVISSKTNFNEFRNNVFYKSEGSLVTRHGNYCIVDGNYFIGDETTENVGGIRLIGTGHWVTNNYFYQLKGENFRSPLAIMNGIPKSPLNRYMQVTDVVVANNSWINCNSPLQFGVGSNVDQKEVLPASEIRSARPIRTTVANNLIYNDAGDEQPIVAHDQLDGIDFQSNIINNQGVGFEAVEGLESKTFDLVEFSEDLWIPNADLSEVDVFNGFGFEQISKDLFGTSRANNNAVGAVIKKPNADPGIMDMNKYGPDWYSSETTKGEGETHTVQAGGNLVDVIEAAMDGDIIELQAGRYEVSSSLKINKRLTIRSAEADNKATILYTGAAETPAFEMNPKAELRLKSIHLKGDQKQYAFASLKSNMSSLYNLETEDCEITDFDYILKAYKYSFSEYITLNSTTFKNCHNGLELSEETDDKGDYNAENIIIRDCHFEGIDKNVIDYYRGGYDESTVGGNLLITNSSFTNCGAKEKNEILLNTYGIINVDISNNTFRNNPVKRVAILWGAKNNKQSGNEIVNSGNIIVEENLKLRLMY